MFDEKTCQALKWYVYLLVNPETRQPFYVGKGENNRVFQHVENVRDGKSKSEPKNEMIKSILDRGEEVIHYIVRHGMDEKTALSVEASLIDAFNLFDATKLTNLVNGHDVEHGLMSDILISNKYSAKCIPPLPHNSIVININKRYHRGISDTDILEATRHWWPIRKDKVDNIKYFLSEYQGLIVGVFEVDDVEHEDVDYTPGTEAAKSGKKRQRYGFKGHVAPAPVRDQYYGKSLPIKAKRFPLLYPDKVNAEICQKYCRYYHGEGNCPESVKQLPAGESLWFYEKRWVEFNMEVEDLQLWLDEYNAYGMSDFSTDDGVPISLKAILFNRYYRGGYVEVGGASFRKWYMRTYLQIDLKKL